MHQTIVTLIGEGAQPSILPNSWPVTHTTVLAENACEVFLSVPVTIEEQHAIRAGFMARRIDINFQPFTKNRRKKLLIADMDSTILQEETLDEMAALAGFGDQVKNITTKAMNGELDFHDALRERVLLLKKKPASLIEDTLATMAYNNGAKELIATMRHHGAHCILASGGFTHFTNTVQQELGFDETSANTLLTENNVFTGYVSEPIADKSTKEKLLKERTLSLGLSIQDTLSVGDGANDIPMLKAASIGVAFRAKQVVRETISIQLNFSDLAGVLYLQGYTRADIISP